MHSGHANYATSSVVQRECPSDLTVAAAMFGVVGEDGSMPLVLIPPPRSCCAAYMIIPSGVYCIVHHCGEDKGDWTPGFQWANGYYNVAFLVTKQSCTYNYPVSYCPTSDNVMVKVDITLAFRIVEPHNFVYKLGPTRMDDLLRGVAEEAIRAMVRTYTNFDIFQLRGSTTREMLLDVLNKVFDPFGVHFTSSTVTNVELPLELSETLQSATGYDAKMREQISAQEFKLKVLNDQNDLKLNETNLANDRQKQALLAQKDRLVIDMEKRKYEAESQKHVATITAEKDVDVAKAGIAAEFEKETYAVQARVEKMTREAEGRVAAQKAGIDQYKETEVLRAEGELTRATNAATALLVEAEAEARAAEEMRDRRSFELQSAAITALKSLASSSRIVISGREGDRLISSLTTGIVAGGSFSGASAAPSKKGL